MKLPRLYDPLAIPGIPAPTITTPDKGDPRAVTADATPGASPIFPHHADLKSGTAVAVASHITTQQRIIDWVEQMPATLENAAVRLKAEEQLAVTWYAGHKVMAYCIASFATGLAVALILFNL